MPSYRFSLEGNPGPGRELELDAPDASFIGLVAKQAARRLASREIASGSLSLTRDLIVRDMAGAEVARYKLPDLIEVA